MNIYLYLFNYIKILCEYSSSKKLLDSILESSTRVTRVTRHSPSVDNSVVLSACTPAMKSSWLAFRHVELEVSFLPRNALKCICAVLGSHVVRPSVCDVGDGDL